MLNARGKFGGTHSDHRKVNANSSVNMYRLSRMNMRVGGANAGGLFIHERDTASGVSQEMDTEKVNKDVAVMNTILTYFLSRMGG